ncbi:CDT protein a [Spatholobus suberectus]|nr:CDT protein a [Spatholobus suberectus]
MKKPSAAASPSCRGRSKKPNLQSSNAQSPSPVQFSSKTPEKPPQRARNRGVALSVAEIRKVGRGLLQDRKQSNETASPQQTKSVRRQISLTSPSKPKTADDEPFKLPEKYEILGKFFHHLDSLIPIFRLKGWTPSFTQISSRIESLSDRRFTYGHLAQLKFVLPEAIIIKKILVHNERTSCMERDLHISINPDVRESDNRRVPLRKLFWSRLRDFWESHPEGDEIPEETLPEPFNRPKKECTLDMLKTRPPTKLSSCMRYTDIVNDADPANINEKCSAPVKISVESPNEHLAAPSHMPQSFTRRFSRKSKENGTDNVQKSPLDSLQPLAFPVSESSLKENPPFEDVESHLKPSPAKLASEAASSERCPTICACLESSGSPLATPSKTIEYTENKDGSLKSIDAMSTPAKLVSTPIRLMSATPALHPPKRHYMSPDDNSTSSLNKLARRPLRSRSLKFDTPVKNKEVVNEDNAGGLPIDDDVFDILPENLIQLVREKERIAMEERDPAISQAKKRKKNIASLPKLFDMIRILLRQRSCITKVELVSKIISSRCDIIDRSEVEEQLNLLQELVPEWISEKLISSGDLLLFINKMLSPETIRASLEEAAE